MLLLIGNYIVTSNGKSVGKVQVLREGLYYRFICRCHITQDKIVRLMVSDNETEINLGILVPLEEGFGLSKRIPAKQFSGGEISFYVSAKQERGRYIPISPEEPFAYLERIKDCFLVRKGDMQCAYLPEREKSSGDYW